MEMALSLKDRLKARLTRFVPKDRRFAFIAIMLATLIVTFLTVANEMLEGHTSQFDNAILLSLRQPGNPAIPIHAKWLLPAMQDITALGGITIVTIVGLSTAGYFILRKKYHLMVFLLLSAGGGAWTISLLKDYFQRPRPSIVPHLQAAMQTSFPSGHSMFSAIVYLTLSAVLAKTTQSYRLKTYYLSIGLFLTIMVGFSRVYLGVHYPTDVLAGWCIGAIWAALTYLIGDWLESRGQIEKEEKSSGLEDPSSTQPSS